MSSGSDFHGGTTAWSTTALPYLRSNYLMNDANEKKNTWIISLELTSSAKMKNKFM